MVGAGEMMTAVMVLRNRKSTQDVPGLDSVAEKADTGTK